MPYNHGGCSLSEAVTASGMRRLRHTMGVASYWALLGGRKQAESESPSCKMRDVSKLSSLTWRAACRRPPSAPMVLNTSDTKVTSVSSYFDACIYFIRCDSRLIAVGAHTLLSLATPSSKPAPSALNISAREISSRQACDTAAKSKFCCFEMMKIHTARTEKKTMGRRVGNTHTHRSLPSASRCVKEYV